MAITPADNHVWVANSAGSDVSRLDNAGAFLQVIPVGSTPTGLSVDADGKVWVTNTNSDNAMRIDPNGGGPGVAAVDLTVSLGAGSGPYNYSDMTGVVAAAAAGQGTWTVVYDSGTLGTAWGTVWWNEEPQGAEPAGTGITVEARASDAPASLPAETFIPVSNGAAFSGLTGQFIEIRSTLARDPGVTDTPVLSDLRLEGANEPPVADAGTDTTIECAGADDTTVQLDGSGSSDPDGDTLTYTWTGPFGTASGPTPTVTLPLGEHTITLTVDDGNGETDSDEVTITVVDTTPPAVTAAFEPVLKHRRDDDDSSDGESKSRDDASDDRSSRASDDRSSDDDDSSDGLYDKDRFTVQYSAADTCDPDPTVGGVIAVPDAEHLRITYKRKGGDDESFDDESIDGESLSNIRITSKITFDLKKGRVTVQGPDPEALWTQIQAAGGIPVDSGQELKIQIKRGRKYEYTFDQEGNLVAIKAPEATLLATATDASGNVGTATATLPLLVATGDDDDSISYDFDDDASKEKGRGKGRGKPAVPAEHALLQNTPNPFNPETTIEYALPAEAHVRLVVHNTMGQTVRTLADGFQPIGYHQVVWDGRDSQGRSVSGGIYFYRLTAGAFIQTKRMILLK